MVRTRVGRGHLAGQRVCDHVQVPGAGVDTADFSVACEPESALFVAHGNTFAYRR